MIYLKTLNPIKGQRSLYILLFLFSFSHKLERPYTITIVNQKLYTKKLITAYAFYITFAKQYTYVFKKIISNSKKSTLFYKLIHKMVLNEHNASQDQKKNLLACKENTVYQELPYLYFKKNLTTTKKKILNLITSLDTEHIIEQSSIIYCLMHICKQIETIEKAVIKMPEYYQEQIKIASKKEPFFTQMLQSGIGFITKKIIPFF